MTDTDPTPDRTTDQALDEAVVAELPQDSIREAYEHPWPVRICHWVNTVSLFVMAGSGLQIFRAFPSFGPRIPEQTLLNVPKSLALGGWLGGALQWHLTFAWIYVATGLFYGGYQILSGNFRQILFVPRDVPGVWPMARHYFFFGRKPLQTEAYNPCRKWPIRRRWCSARFRS